ncbi:MAG: xanthine dehydrogenase accessory factor [Pseudomonadota bacterium]|nr:xanthine dehydrogenase accessory factor [Pseudomonadota bacterium]
MTGSDLQIVGRICEWLGQQHEVVLFTVIQTWGSSPRPAGSLLAICANGEFAGSVSGSCIDDDLLRRTADGNFHQCQPHFIYYGETADSQNRFNLPCGGALKLLVETGLSLPQFTVIAEKIAQRERICRRICLSTHESSLHAATSHSVLHAHEQNLMRNFGPGWRLLLIGAGELSQCVCTLAELFDYQVSVCDPREAYQASWPLRHIAVSGQMPDDLVREAAVDDTTAILALSHDPKLDDMALMIALEQNAFYVGAIGSKKNNSNRRQRLLQLGLTRHQVDQLHGPVGLDIGSRTPAEIALAILADITAHRHGKKLVSVS